MERAAQLQASLHTQAAELGRERKQLMEMATNVEHASEELKERDAFVRITLLAPVLGVCDGCCDAAQGTGEGAAATRTRPPRLCAATAAVDQCIGQERKRSRSLRKAVGEPALGARVSRQRVITEESAHGGGAAAMEPARGGGCADSSSARLSRLRDDHHPCVAHGQRDTRAVETRRLSAPLLSCLLSHELCARRSVSSQNTVALFTFQFRVSCLPDATDTILHRQRGFFPERHQTTDQSLTPICTYCEYGLMKKPVKRSQERKCHPQQSNDHGQAAAE